MHTPGRDGIYRIRIRTIKFQCSNQFSNSSKQENRSFRMYSDPNNRHLHETQAISLPKLCLKCKALLAFFLSYVALIACYFSFFVGPNWKDELCTIVLMATSRNITYRRPSFDVDPSFDFAILNNEVENTLHTLVISLIPITFSLD